jgi:hypothetical protein
VFHLPLEACIRYVPGVQKCNSGRPQGCPASSVSLSTSRVMDSPQIEHDSGFGFDTAAPSWRLLGRLQLVDTVDWVRRIGISRLLLAVIRLCCHALDSWSDGIQPFQSPLSYATLLFSVVLQFFFFKSSETTQSVLDCMSLGIVKSGEFLQDSPASQSLPVCPECVRPSANVAPP